MSSGGGVVGAGAVWRIECSVEGWRGAVALMYSLIAPFQLSTGRGRTVPARRLPGPPPDAQYDGGIVGQDQDRGLQQKQTKKE